MDDRSPNPVEIHILRMLRDPRVTAALLADAMEEPPRRFRDVILAQTEARVLHAFPAGYQRRYWQQMASATPRQRRAHQRQTWRYSLLKDKLVGAESSGSG